MTKISKFFYILSTLLNAMIRLKKNFLKSLFNTIYNVCKAENSHQMRNEALSKTYYCENYLNKGDVSYNQLYKSIAPLKDSFNSKTDVLLLSDQLINKKAIKVFCDSLINVFNLQSINIYVAGPNPQEYQLELKKYNLESIIIEHPSQIKNSTLLFFEPCWFRPDLLIRLDQTRSILSDRVISTDSCFYDQELDRIFRYKRVKRPISYDVADYEFNSLGPIIFIPKELIPQIISASLTKIYSNLNGHKILNIQTPLSAIVCTVECLEKYSFLKKVNEIGPTIKLTSTPTVKVIIPFKDQPILTRKAIDTLKCQKKVSLSVVLVNNRSKESDFINSIREDSTLNIIDFDHEFNFSLMNNIAANFSLKSNCDYLLFMNNDIELIDDLTIFNMCKYAEVKNIGLVGIKLLYPNSAIQHGGVDLTSSDKTMRWAHTDHGLKENTTSLSSFTRVTDSVTAACSLMKYSIFQEVDGFSQSYFPIAYSDTALSQSILSKGYKSLYVANIKAIHHESASRGYNAIEDFESSTFLGDILGLSIPSNSIYIQH